MTRPPSDRILYEDLGRSARGKAENIIRLRKMPWVQALGWLRKEGCFGEFDRSRGEWPGRNPGKLHVVGLFS